MLVMPLLWEIDTREDIWSLVSKGLLVNGLSTVLTTEIEKNVISLCKSSRTSSLYEES